MILSLCLFPMLRSLIYLARDLLLASLLVWDHAERPISNAEIAISSPIVESCDLSQMTAAETTASTLYKGNEVANEKRKTVCSL